MKKPKVRCPDDYTVEGWNRNNNYLCRVEDFESTAKYTQERFRRACAVQRAWLKTAEGRELSRLATRASWDERSKRAKEESDTTEVLLLEKITTHEEGFSTAELVAGCINIIARELAKRGVRDVEKLELKDLILISNNLLGLTKAAAAVKKEQGWKPNVQVNNVTVTTSSKTGGVVGGLKDVIDLKDERQRIAAEIAGRG